MDYFASVAFLTATLSRYLAYFPRDRVRVYLFEDFIADPSSVVREVSGTNETSTPRKPSTCQHMPDLIRVQVRACGFRQAKQEADHCQKRRCAILAASYGGRHLQWVIWLRSRQALTIRSGERRGHADWVRPGGSSGSSGLAPSGNLWEGE